MGPLCIAKFRFAVKCLSLKFGSWSFKVSKFTIWLCIGILDITSSMTLLPGRGIQVIRLEVRLEVTY
jgi:hypothetical protein